MKKTSFWRIGTAVLVVGSILYTMRAGRRRSDSPSIPADEYDDLLPEYKETFDQNPIVPAGWTFANGPYFLLPFVAGFAGIATRQYGKNTALTGALAIAAAAVAARWVWEVRFRPLPTEVADLEYDEEEALPWWENEGRNEDRETYSYTSL
ncbi:hypothetical protein [Larkinella soli]|uniref:hypothetical protein n=1 Tax=Larkinella soli TaxID=1770527 RepID=UPI000FFB5B41|nr:hypothetical protein [Larkinella soli]